MERTRSLAALALAFAAGCSGTHFSVADGGRPGDADLDAPLPDAFRVDNANKHCLGAPQDTCYGMDLCCYHEGAAGTCESDLGACPSGCNATTTPVGCETPVDCPGGTVCCGHNCGGKFDWVGCLPSSQCGTAPFPIVCAAHEVNAGMCNCPGGQQPMPALGLPEYEYCP